MKFPLVSVVIPSYNYGRYIKTAVDSVLSQDYPNLELIVSDNVSTDDTLDVLAQYKDDPRFRLNVNDVNIGLTPNINKGISFAKGDYVVVLSADDFLLGGHTSKLVEIAEQHPEIALVYGNAYLAEVNGIPYQVRFVWGQVKARYVGGRDELPSLLGACYVCLPTALFRKRMLEKYGFFDEALGIASDWEICVRMAAGGEQFAYTPDPVAAIRVHPDQRSAYEYQRSGDELRDAIEICDRYLTEKYFDRYHGHEYFIAITLDARLKRTREANPAKAADLQQRLYPYSERLSKSLGGRSDRPDPKISVVVPSTGGIVQIRRALASLDAQTHTNWEAIVVQDAGFDVETLVRTLPPARRVRFVRTAETLGATAARNTGLMLAHGDCIAFLDEDDEFAPDHLSTLLSAMKSTGSLAAFSGTCTAIDQFTVALAATTIAQAEEALPFGPTSEDLEVAPCIPLGAMLFDVALLSRLISFDERFGLLSGWELMLRAARQTQLAFSGLRTFREHAAVGLERQMLGKTFPYYTQLLDAVHSMTPASTPEILGRRKEHRQRIAPLFDQPATAYHDAAALVRLYASLSGQHVARTVTA
jgi:glycosyltransferase involved in cell wall biosynthesis